MKILLTNDDGLRAPGIQAMYEALVDAHGECGGPLGGAGLEVVPIAPLTVQSATSHGVTFHEPLMVREERLGWGTRAGGGGSARDERVTGIAVDGRPADCVKLALTVLWGERFGAGSAPDLVVSGMNAGANVGINVIYSGTVAAALEAAFLGIPAIAVSLHMGKKKADFRAAARQGRLAIEAILKGGLPDRHACLSINVPMTELADGAAEGSALRDASGRGGFRDYPIRVAKMNTHGLVDKFERRVSPSGDVYYWASGHGLDFRSTEAESDVELIMRKCTTVTPLRYDLTKKSVMEMWRRRIEGDGGKATPPLPPVSEKARVEGAQDLV